MKRSIKNISEVVVALSILTAILLFVLSMFGPTIHEVDVTETKYGAYPVMKKFDNHEKQGTAYIVRYFGDFTVESSMMFNEKINHVLSVAKDYDVLVVHVESHGGAAAACSNDYRLVRMVSESGVKTVSMTDYAANSCGYMLMAGADNILSAEGASIGNIGVIRRHGIQKHPIIASTPTKAAEAGDAPTPEAMKLMKERLALRYEIFKAAVRSTRGDRLPYENEKVAFSGAVLVGIQAAKLGLVDEVINTQRYLMRLKMDGYRIVVVEYNEPLKLNWR